jgi:hypothetical protein
MAKIAILTNFMEFNPGYSLTGIVQDQSRMLLSYGHEVFVYVNASYQADKYPALPQEDFARYGLDESKFHVVADIPFAHLIDYQSIKDLSEDHKKTVEETANMLVAQMPEMDYVFTHDFLFTGWFLPYGLGVKVASQHEDLKKVRWFDWLHSVPSALRDWWNIREWGPRHRLVYPNRTDLIRVAEQYRGGPENVRPIPHIKDLRSWWDFDQETCEFINDHSGVMQADVVKVYPASTDRLQAKRLDSVIQIMSEIKRRGLSVCMVIANQWATGTQPKENVNHYYEIASRNGLRRDEEFIFTSEWKEKWATGIPRRMLRELMLCANLFIFPTREESFGLVGPEAALEGQFCVWNKSLQMQIEVHGMTGMFVDFGSYHNNFEPPDKGQYIRDVTSLIISRMRRNESLMTKTWSRQTYNWDKIYRMHYEPSLAESALWA